MVKSGEGGGGGGGGNAAGSAALLASGGPCKPCPGSQARFQPKLAVMRGEKGSKGALACIG